VCTHYKYDNKETKDLPYDMVNKKITPTTQTFKSWGNIDAAKPLPAELNTYVDFLEKYLNVPVAMVSNGPGREQLIDLTEGKLLA
jgi:adenylosuccinate synthase